MPSTCFIFFSSSFIIIINSVVNFSAKFTCLEVSTPYKKKRTKKKKLVLILQSVLCWKYTRIKQKQIKELRVRKHIKMEISEFCLCRYPPWHCRIQKVFLHIYGYQLWFSLLFYHMNRQHFRSYWITQQKKIVKKWAHLYPCLHSAASSFRSE